MYELMKDPDYENTWDIYIYGKEDFDVLAPEISENLGEGEYLAAGEYMDPKEYWKLGVGMKDTGMFKNGLPIFKKLYDERRNPSTPEVPKT